MLVLSAEQLKYPDIGINYSPMNRLGKRFMIDMWEDPILVLYLLPTLPF